MFYYLSKCQRFMAHCLGITSFLNNIVTHYRPRPFCVKILFCHDKSSNAIIKLLSLKLTKHLKHAFPMFVANINN